MQRDFQVIDTFKNVQKFLSRIEASWVVGHRQNVQIHHHDSHRGSLIWNTDCITTWYKFNFKS